MSKLLIKPTNGYTKPKDEKNVGNYPNTLVEAVYYDEKGESLDAFLNELESSIADSEKATNKVTTLSSSSTDEQYPSAKAVYDAIQAGGGGGGECAFKVLNLPTDMNMLGTQNLTKEEFCATLEIDEEQFRALMYGEYYCVSFKSVYGTAYSVFKWYLDSYEYQSVDMDTDEMIEDYGWSLTYSGETVSSGYEGISFRCHKTIYDEESLYDILIYSPV